MEERRTNKHGLWLDLNVRREKVLALFGHFCASVAVWLSRTCIRVKFPHYLHATQAHSPALANPASGSTGPNAFFSNSLSLSDSCLSLTIANSSLLNHCSVTLPFLVIFRTLPCLIPTLLTLVITHCCCFVVICNLHGDSYACVVYFPIFMMYNLL